MKKKSASRPAIRRQPATAVTLPKDPKKLAALKLSRLSGDEKLAARFVKAGITSIAQIAALSPEILRKRVGGKLTGAEELALHVTLRNARRMSTYTADKAMMAALDQSPNGRWLAAGFTGKHPLSPFCHCGCCDSIFSLKAYLFDLLDLVGKCWELDMEDIEAVLQRSFRDLYVFHKPKATREDLTCEALNAPIPQTRIGVEVLESYLGSLGKPLPTSVATWKKRFVDRLLRLITPRDVQVAVLTGLPSTEKLTMATVDAQPNLPPDFAAALAAWKVKLNTLVLNLAGIDEAVSLLSDYDGNFTGFAPGTLRPADDEDETIEEKRRREVTKMFEEGRDGTMRHWLVDYRSALVTATGSGVEQLETSLFVSFSLGPCRTTTRLQELVIALQQIVENVRSGEIAAIHRPDLDAALTSKLHDASALVLDEPSWERMRDYESWLGSMYGWVYPENAIQIGDPNMVADEGELLQFTVPDPLTMETARESYMAALAVPGTSTVGPDSIAHTTIALGMAVILGQNPFDIDSYSSFEAEELENAIYRPASLQKWAKDINSIFPKKPRQQLLQILKLADAFHLRGDLASAHAWYRCALDPVTGFVHEALKTTAQGETAPLDEDPSYDTPFDPVAIAFRRPGVWRRYVILAMTRNLVDMADDDFARGLPDTIQRAEECYELARKVLGAGKTTNECEQLITNIRSVIVEFLGAKKGLAARYAAPLQGMRSVKMLEKAEKDIRKTLDGKGTTKQKHLAIRRRIAKAVKEDRQKHRPQSLATEWKATLAEGSDLENAVFRERSLDGLAGKPFFGFDPGRLPGVPGLFPPGSVLVVTIWPKFCVPLNPMLNLLRRQIDTQLLKLRLCMDFAGEPQAPRVYGCDTYDASTGQINRPTATLDQFNATTDQPRYRYNFLVEKARQYVDVAQRFGTLLLQALQARDNEAFAQLKAEQAIELAGASVELRRLGQIEAGDGVNIAELQSGRAASQVVFWDDRAGDDIDTVWDSMSPAEQTGLALSATAAGLASLAVLPAALGAGIGAAITAGGVATSATGVLAGVGIPMTASGFMLTLGSIAALGAGLSSAASAAGAASSTALTYASFERRLEDWKNQYALAQFDTQIAGLQVTLANDRAAIAEQEMVIAQLQLSQAREELRFLQTKITSVAFYDWMVRVLTRDYRTLMQIAACVARMAQRALEFERQEAVRIIAGDYWNVATDVFAVTGLSEKQRSLGLLGAERLLTDLTKLDAFKLVTEQRRQQISKTISLARMMPTDLVELRRSGTMTFNTLMEWFDDDFQGHYLRLIKSVKVTVLAIVPPIDGIHAMLHNTGESSVVVTEDGELTFTKKRAMRNFGERISLDAPFNESGLFVLNYEDPMLLPFEGLGVETQWTLDIPRGNNRFSFDTIADVLLTIDYTAEYSPEYEERQREERSNAVVYEDTAVPLRLQFPDVWYHFKNQRKDAAGVFPPFPFKFHLPRTAFAMNLADSNPNFITVVHLTLLVSGDLTPAEQDLVADGLMISHQGTPLHQGAVPRPAPTGSPAGTPGSAGDPASAFGQPLFGTGSLLLSTRGDSANGLRSNPRIGTTTPDEWRVEFSAALFPTVIDKITDVLLVVTVRGKRA